MGCEHGSSLCSKEEDVLALHHVVSVRSRDVLHSPWLAIESTKGGAFLCATLADSRAKYLSSVLAAQVVQKVALACACSQRVHKLLLL